MEGRYRKRNTMSSATIATIASAGKPEARNRASKVGRRAATQPKRSGGRPHGEVCSSSRRAASASKITSAKRAYPSSLGCNGSQYCAVQKYAQRSSRAVLDGVQPPVGNGRDASSRPPNAPKASTSIHVGPRAAHTRARRAGSMWLTIVAFTLYAQSSCAGGGIIRKMGAVDDLDRAPRMSSR